VPALRRQIGSPTSRVTDSKSAGRQTRAKCASIENERDKLVGEIARLRGSPDSSLPSIDTARTLLTRHWIKGDWRTREQLIAAARWLIQLEGAHRLRSIETTDNPVRESGRW
jgi:hypothetical protein